MSMNYEHLIIQSKSISSICYEVWYLHEQKNFILSVEFNSNKII